MYAARPMITDDARVVDRHSCQLETWGVLTHTGSEYYIVPACNMFLGLEVSLGGKLSNMSEYYTQEQRGARWEGKQILGGIKKVFGDLESDGYSFGFALGNVYNFRRSIYANDPYLYLPFSIALFDNRLFIHTNVGYKLSEQQAIKRIHIYNVGLGGEYELGERLWILAESFYERLDVAKYQLGLRIWLIKDRVQLDSTYGNAFRGGESFVSIGLRLLSPQLF